MSFAAGGMVGFKVCSGTFAVAFALVPLFHFVHFPSCRTFPHFVQAGRCQRPHGTRGLRGTERFHPGDKGEDAECGLCFMGALALLIMVLPCAL